LDSTSGRIRWVSDQGTGKPLQLRWSTRDRGLTSLLSGVL
jgi:hypothetical protein